MKNFLSIVWYRILPPEYGGQKGIACFNEYLGKKLPLTCLCSKDNIPDKQLSYKVYNELPVSRFQFWKPSVKKQILAFIREKKFSDIIIEHPYHGWLGKYKKELGFRFIVHAHNIEYQRMKARKKLWWRLIKSTERSAFSIADHILFKTKTDQQKAIGIFGIDPVKCLVVPYGIKETGPPSHSAAIKDHIRRRHNIAADEKIILFAGTLDYEPNARALQVIIRQVIPLLQQKQFRFRVIVCGALPIMEIIALNTIPNLVAAGFIPLLHEYMQSADVFINPVTSGSGVQTKNVEALAEGCTIVSTVFASTGLPDYIPGEKLFICPDNDWQQFADTIIRASTVNTTTPQRFYDEYNWAGIVDKLLDELTS